MLVKAQIEHRQESHRVLGWDLLRGMCAVAVAAYHLLYWQDVATVHTVGSYGVYLFFILSGASLAYSYVAELESGQFSVARFLWIRYLRIAPLYLALMFVALPWKLLKDGANFNIALTYLLNATFLFGFFNPSENAVLVGGWSLGIEAIFYLLFPLIMLSFCRAWLVAIVFATLVTLQAAWIFWAFNYNGGYSQNPSQYFQAPAFSAYFMGGCVLGVLKRKRLLDATESNAQSLFILIGGFVSFVALNPVLAGDEIVGWRGVLLVVICFSMVYTATRLSVQRVLENLSRYFGDATYGLYLLHPVLFFGLVQIVFPRLGLSSPSQWTLEGRLLFGAAIIGLAFYLAILSERYFEKPLRQYFLRKSSDVVGRAAAK